MLKLVSLNWRLMLPLLGIALSGCAPPLLRPSAEPARVPSLPSQARVSLVPIPSMCSVSCSHGVMQTRENSASMLTGSAVPGSLVSVPTADYSLRNNR